MARLLVVLAAVVGLLVPFGSPDRALAQSGTEDLKSLAVYPFRLAGRADQYSAVIMKALYDVLDEVELFEPAYSSVSGDDRYAPKPLRVQQELWIRKGFLSDFEPDKDLVFDLGAQQGVDAVITYVLELKGAGRDRLVVYLFDIARKKVYMRRITTEIIHPYTNEVSVVTLDSFVRDITRDVFYKF